MIDLQAMLADLELLVNTESPSNDVPRLSESADALLEEIEQSCQSPASGKQELNRTGAGGTDAVGSLTPEEVCVYLGARN